MNLSSKPLSSDCLQALEKGLSFVPTTYCNEFNVFLDFQKFFRTLRLKEFFSSNDSRLNLCPPTQHNTNSPPVNNLAIDPGAFHKKSTFMPPKNKNFSVETYCRLVERDVGQVLNKKREYTVFNNMPVAQRNALHDIKNDKSVVIKPADKGGSIVVMDTQYYDQEIYRQLQNQSFYTKLRGDPTNNFKKEIYDSLQTFLLRGDVTNKEFEFLKVDYPITPVIYILPKIHKNLAKPPGRPIIAGMGSLIEKISVFVDSFLKPHVQSLPSFVQDSQDMIKILQSVSLPQIPTLLVTLDVESLYTNIPHDGGIQAIDFFLREFLSDKKPTIECLKELTKLVLTKNYFMYKDDYFLQIKGTAMGSTMAPNYANLYMGFFEHEYVFNPTVNSYLSNILLWRRYIDDIFMIWCGSENDLLVFQQFLNHTSEHLKFTIEFNPSQVSFLDLLIIKDGSKLVTDLYRKPTDKNTFLHGLSFHPTKLKKSLPISQFKRIRRICSDTETFEKQRKELCQRFYDRGYSTKWIKEAAARFENMDQKEALVRKTLKPTNTRISCIIQYSALSNEFANIVRRHWHILNSDPVMRHCCKDPPRIVFKRAPNVRQMIVRADQGSDRSDNPFSVPEGNYRCGQCAQCNFTTKCQFFSHPHSGKQLKIKGVISCNTKNVIYMIKCPCGLAYIGKTRRCLKTRIAEHRSNIRLNDQRNPIAVHFNALKHNLATLRYIGIEQVKVPRRGGDVDRLLLQREAFYIYTLNTLSPRGLNLDFDLKSFL